MESPLEFRNVSIWELRRRFNEGRYWERARAGEFQQIVKYNGRPNPADSGEPYCTRSQIVVYVDEQNQKIAHVHQYLRPDGTIGGAGKPDPKRLLEEGVVYQAD